MRFITTVYLWRSFTHKQAPEPEQEGGVHSENRDDTVNRDEFS